EVCDRQRHNPNRSPAFWGGHDAGVSCAVHAAWALWMLGYHGRATAKMRAGIAWARASAHPFTLAFACHYATAFHQARREVHAVAELADPAIAHSTEHGCELFRRLGAVDGGWLLAARGRGEEGVDEMRSGLAAYREHGAGFGVATFLGILAEAYQELGRAKDG